MAAPLGPRQAGDRRRGADGQPTGTGAAGLATGAGLGLTGFLLSAVLHWSHARVETLRGFTNLDRMAVVWANASGAGVFVVVLVGAPAWIYAANPPARSVLSTVRPTTIPA